MKILITGREGQVARSLAERAPAGHDLRFAARPELDLADPASIRRAVRAVGPDAIVSAAAYTAVDRAEEEPDLAFAVNAVAPGVLAEEAARAGARLIHFSTDYVYDGQGTEPWREDAPVAPINAYGRTKLAGEAAARAALPDAVILRTAWVYSPFGRNFVRTMLTLAETRPRLRVVDDQVGNPTSALDIADALFAIVRRWKDEPVLGVGLGLGATFHVAGSGFTSWADLARQIFAVSRAAGGPGATVEGIATADYPTPAARPRNSRLDTARFHDTFGYRAPDWRESVRVVVERLVTYSA